MNKYTEEIMLKFGIEKGSLNDIKKSIEGITAAKDIKFDINKDAYKNVDKLVKDFKKAMTFDVINPKKWAKALHEAEKEAKKSAIRKFFTGSEGEDITKESVSAHAVDKLGKIVKKGFDSVLTSFKEAWTDLRELVGYSKLSTRSVREQMFSYGFTFAENYAFDKTMGLLGLSDVEDLWYLNQQEQSKFMEKFGEYSDRYTQLYDQGFFEEMEQYDWEMQEFKEDLKYSFMQWFVDNRDIIKSGMEAIMTIAKWVLKAFGWIFGGSGTVSESEKAAKNAEILNTYGNHYGNVSNVSVDVGGVTNNYARPGVDTSATNPAEMTYRQILQVLNGRRYA